MAVPAQGGGATGGITVLDYHTFEVEEAVVQQWGPDMRGEPVLKVRCAKMLLVGFEKQSASGDGMGCQLLFLRRNEKRREYIQFVQDRSGPVQIIMNRAIIVNPVRGHTFLPKKLSELGCCSDGCQSCQPFR